MKASARNGHLNGHAKAAPAPPKRSHAKKAAAAPTPKRTAKATAEDRSAVARRIYAAQLGRRAADAEWALALTVGVGAAVIPDTAAKPEEAGTNRVVYEDAGIQITLQVAAPIAGLNVPGLLADLVKAGVAPRLITRLRAKHATETRAAHKFVCTARV